ncbi:MAG: hypothetical protein M3Y55_14230 [Pseudomonadota bacterium]|nr:hypothetical protein [Pseudomonadota bacterium]
MSTFAIQEIPAPSVTALALDWLDADDERLGRAQRVLLQTIDGRRNVIQLESVARALGLQDDALARLCQRGLIRLPTTGARRIAAS